MAFPPGHVASIPCAIPKNPLGYNWCIAKTTSENQSTPLLKDHNRLASHSILRPAWALALPIVFGSLVAARGQSLVDMMVDFYMVYIAAIGPLLGAALLRRTISDTAANASMARGCVIATTCYVIRWTGVVTIPEAAPLLISLSIAFAVAISLRPHPLPKSDELEDPRHSYLWPENRSFQSSTPPSSRFPPDPTGD